MIGGTCYCGQMVTEVSFWWCGVWRLFKLVRGQNLNLNPVSNQIEMICLVFVLAAPMFECMKLEFATTRYKREILTGMDFLFCLCVYI